MNEDGSVVLVPENVIVIGGNTEVFGNKVNVNSGLS